MAQTLRCPQCGGADCDCDGKMHRCNACGYDGTTPVEPTIDPHAPDAAERAWFVLFDEADEPDDADLAAMRRLLDSLASSVIAPPLLPRPYENSAFVDVVWSDISAEPCRVDELIPTQECIRLDRLADLAAGGAPEGGDEALHVIQLDGRLLIHDGTTRWVLAHLRGEASIPCRVLRPVEAAA